ncbi:exported hypothetical protein [Clostridioides difficile]|uniref:Uncharacterized protein n=1 Tax=Clostridioides difficile TaxID=1496 RepID=A0A069ATM0_CLODI|nr:exported hypothetical protein [Clostridioides difficile]
MMRYCSTVMSIGAVQSAAWILWTGSSACAVFDCWLQADKTIETQIAEINFFIFIKYPFE